MESPQIRLSGIIDESVVDGPGIDMLFLLRAVSIIAKDVIILIPMMKLRVT